MSRDRRGVEHGRSVAQIHEHEEALAAAERAAGDSRGPSISPASELIEATARSGKPECAADPLASLGAIVEPADTAFGKLEIGSRKELRAAMSDAAVVTA